MKKSILVLLTAFGINALVAQSNVMDPNAPNVPSTVTNKFTTDYPNNNAKVYTKNPYCCQISQEPFIERKYKLFPSDTPWHFYGFFWVCK